MTLNTPYEELVKFQKMSHYDATKLLQERDPGCTIQITFDGYLIIGPEGEVLRGITTTVLKEPKKPVEVEIATAPEKKKWFNWPRF
jgi:hypothetical protein